MRTLAIVLALTTMIATPQPISSAMVEFITIRQAVTVTAYTPKEMKCPNGVCITASGKQAKPGIIAISRDLEHRGLRFGDRVTLSGLGTYEIQDRMHHRKKYSVDVFMQSYGQAVKFGKQKRLLIAILKGGVHG